MNEKEKVLPDGKFELDFDIDLDFEREELQMPELSQGKFLHDFKVCYPCANNNHTNGLINMW